MSPAPDSLLPRPGTAYRWTVLLFVSLAMFGNYYVYDALNPVVDLLRSPEAGLGLSYQQIGMLSTAYTVAALVVLLASGYVIDRFGARRAIVAFAALCVVAAAVSASAQNFPALMAGRFLLGLGAEPLIVEVTAVLAKWFKGKELSMALGLNISVSRLGSVINGIVIPQIYNNDNMDKLGLALLVGFFVCIFSLICALWLGK